MSAQKNGAVRAVNPSDEPEARVEEAKPADAQEAPASAQAAEAEKKKRKSFVLPIVAVALLAAGGWYGYQYWTDGRFLISTDDAYVQGDIAVIAPKVSGYVAKVDVVDNQTVKAGDTLVTLDDGDYRNALEQAEAQLQTQQLSLNRIDAQIAGAQASLAQAIAQKGSLDAALRGADINLKRASELQAKDVGTAASSDNAQIAMEQAKANLVAGEAGVVSAQANIDLLKAQRKEAEGSVKSLEISRDKAARDLSFTVLRAPYDGVIGNLSVQTGDLLSVGKRLASLVPMDNLYIDANFKETQLADIEPGSKVRVHVDAFGKHDIEATVQSISPASGSVFSMLPPENATGNFTKVIQRVPVRIVFSKEDLAKHKLRAGLSVVVDVDTRTSPDNTRTAENQSK
ncbi:HlyD family secretion protein [Agrobacterium rubi]|uniref:HlyD family secretion protein n=1 Tax=Agrobacterium rubi TaxID=28099 RepID=A0AAE7R6N5_9HYPH|nr:HlyD family secretion protein [Agrobacterium rubi]NTE89188.1 HlyD family secretion protein [Agrobacterium rubi]NTF04970.1 HlyD family secretion protein [Agrobacterium rubi]NTF38740.1 HlyD family secretion protein [Agrobacterium rubi]OCJ43217.1 hemolysin D [Agrobacterium rubi]QTF99931.1 HlyD family secretion protein [Agrobacterium rubi]